MTTNLLREKWAALDSAELRLMLDECIGGPGQYGNRSSNQDEFHLPIAGSSCRIVLIFRDSRIAAITPGPAFDAAKWKRLREEIEGMLLAGPPKVGREYSFSSFRVLGWWRGERSGVQILPPPESAPRAPVEIAGHPFILEFPIKASNLWSVTNYRRMREHRDLTLLLNALLQGHMSTPLRRSEHLWVGEWADGRFEVKWVQRSFFANLGKAVIDELSPPTGEPLAEVEPEVYYMQVGHDGGGVRVPTDLDQSLCLYWQLSATNRAKLDRATFWLDIAHHQWNVSVSASFAALV